MSKVQSIHAHEILDSRGVPTIRGIMILDTGQKVTTEVPAGMSVSKYEAKEMRDNDSELYAGMGTKTACSYISSVLAPKLKGVDVTRQSDVDKWLLEADGTDDRSKLGSNTLLTVSQLFIKAGAAASNLPLFKYISSHYASYHKSDSTIKALPSPIINVINGAKHGSSTLDFQEFHCIPSTSFTFSDALSKASQVYQTVKKILEYRNVGTFVSEQGGFAPNLMTNEDGLEVIKEAVLQAKLRMGVDMHTGLDCAATGYFINKKYKIKDKPEALSSED
ncbi:MAG: phosphopyruvate hydratase, partial [Candidatus Roizmanbacteria bacterium]